MMQPLTCNVHVKACSTILKKLSSIQTGATATVSTFATVVGQPNTPTRKKERNC